MSTIKVIGLDSASGLNFTIQRKRVYELESSLALSLIRDGICAHCDSVPADIPKAEVTINDNQKQPEIENKPQAKTKVLPKSNKKKK